MFCFLTSRLSFVLKTAFVQWSLVENLLFVAFISEKVAKSREKCIKYAKSREKCTLACILLAKNLFIL